MLESELSGDTASGGYRSMGYRNKGLERAVLERESSRGTQQAGIYRSKKGYRSKGLKGLC